MLPTLDVPSADRKNRLVCCGVFRIAQVRTATVDELAFEAPPNFTSNLRQYRAHPSHRTGQYASCMVDPSDHARI